MSFSVLPPDEEAKARLALEPVTEELHVIPLRHQPLRHLMGRVGQWSGGPPADVLPFSDRRFADVVRELRARIRFDAAIVQFPYMAENVSLCAGLPTVMDVQDVCFVSRLRQFLGKVGAWPRLRGKVSWLAWMRHELRWYARADALMALTDVDRTALHMLLPLQRSFTNPPVIDARDLVPCPPDGVLRVGFAGSFDHAPNLDGLKWLSEEIAPALARRCPGVEIAVAGRGIPELLMRSLDPRLKCLGFVEDYSAFVQSCAVFVAPLRIGGGVKIKVLEALACGRPVVASPVGAEGIGMAAEDGLTVATTVEGIAEALAAHLHDPAGSARAGARGAARIRNDFSEAAAVTRLEDCLATIVRPVPQSRPSVASGRSATVGALLP